MAESSYLAFGYLGLRVLNLPNPRKMSSVCKVIARQGLHTARRAWTGLKHLRVCNIPPVVLLFRILLQVA